MSATKFTYFLLYFQLPEANFSVTFLQSKSHNLGVIFFSVHASCVL